MDFEKILRKERREGYDELEMKVSMSFRQISITVTRLGEDVPFFVGTIKGNTVIESPLHSQNSPGLTYAEREGGSEA